MSAPPLWINGKLVCQHPIGDKACGMEMWIRDGYAVCENMTHGGLFKVPEKPAKQPKPSKEPTEVSTWKALLPLAERRFRRTVTIDGQRRSYGVWRVSGDAEHAWRPASEDAFDVRQGIEVPTGWIVARFTTTGNGCRTVLLRPVEMSEEDKEWRRWDQE